MIFFDRVFSLHLLSFSLCEFLFLQLGDNGRNYMQLGIAGCFPVEPRCCCCGLRTLLSTPKPQLTYSFCYVQALFLWIIFIPLAYLPSLHSQFLSRLLMVTQIKTQLEQEQSQPFFLHHFRLATAHLRLHVFRHLHLV